MARDRWRGVMHHRTTHHKVTRDAPPTLRHDPKPQEGRDETNPFCVPFGHVVKSRVARYFPLVRNDLRRLTPCCTAARGRSSIRASARKRTTAW